MSPVCCLFFWLLFISRRVAIPPFPSLSPCFYLPLIEMAASESAEHLYFNTHSKRLQLWQPVQLPLGCLMSLSAQQPTLSPSVLPPLSHSPSHTHNPPVNKGVRHRCLPRRDKLSEGFGFSFHHSGPRGNSPAHTHNPFAPFQIYTQSLSYRLLKTP